MIWKEKVKISMNRCNKCILPKNYPGTTFNEEGVCNYCIKYRGIEYPGGEALKKDIKSFLKKKKDINKNFDCVLGFSGGRDSSYLLYYLTKALNLRVLAYSVDNGFIPEHTIQNMKNMTDKLNVKLVIEKNDYLKKCLKYHIISWMYRPSPAMVGILCTGCRLGMDVGTLNFAKKNKVPVVIIGGTPFEGQGYKYNLMKINVNSKRNSSFVLGYISQIIRNPIWILSPTSLITQIKEYLCHYRQMLIKEDGLLYLSPFWSYIRWKENEVVSTIENELDWEKDPRIESTWRGDCDIAQLKLYLYRKTLGFNDKDDGLSCLIRDNQITREEALKRIEKEAEVPEDMIRRIFEKLDINFSELQIALRKMEKTRIFERERAPAAS